MFEDINEKRRRQAPTKHIKRKESAGPAVDFYTQRAVRHQRKKRIADVRERELMYA